MKRLISATLFISTLLSSLACVANDQNRKLEWQQWVEKYDSGRRSADGWLSLAGLFWLKDGDNTLGSSLDNRHRLPQGMPAYFGSINVDKKNITFTRADKEILINDKDVGSMQLKINETEVTWGTYSFYIIERERGFAVRLKNTKNPAIAKYSGTQFHPYSEDWVIPARLIRHEKPEKVNIPTIYNTVRENDSAGWLEFEYQGEMHRLQAVSYGEEHPMSLMFADKTNQESTYGAGRFLEVQWPSEGDLTIIDFNWAYNPPCAITPYATCPLPPKQNRLGIEIDAGELYELKYD
ncbi:MAG: DUF1684 domain-containing protein [Acidiferrobacterales bacterium]|nr:DUF1684 domain-containing protein [Acidiferrobacterales bacterium]